MEEQQCHRLPGHLLGHTAVQFVVAIVADGHWHSADCLSQSLLPGAVRPPPGVTPKGRGHHDANQWLCSLIVRPSWEPAQPNGKKAQIAVRTGKTDPTSPRADRNLLI